MARVARLLIEGAVYHVTARGNRREQIFSSQAITAGTLDTLSAKSTAFALELLGWCLMPNHVHLLVRERQPRALSKTIRSVHGAYAVRLNHRLGQGSGHAWQGRFYSVPVPTDRVWTVLRYIELNPVRAGLASTAGAFPWSTAQYHLGIRKLECLSVSDWLQDWCPAQWAEALATGVRGEEELIIRRATRLGIGRRPAQRLVIFLWAIDIGSSSSDIHSVCPSLSLSLPSWAA